MSDQLRGILNYIASRTDSGPNTAYYFRKKFLCTTPTQNLPKSSLTQERLTNLALMHVHKDIAATVVDDKKNSCSTLLAESLSVLGYLAISDVGRARGGSGAWGVGDTNHRRRRTVLVHNFNALVIHRTVLHYVSLAIRRTM